MKLIKLSDTHYIIVDDSEIKVGDFVYSMDGIHQWFGDVLKTEPLPQKITHSTEPLEITINKYNNGEDVEYIFFNTKPISISEVEELIYGYNTQKMFISWMKSYADCYNNEEEAYEAGFRAHQELVKDRLFTIEDMRRAISETRKGMLYNKLYEDEYIQSLLPKTEWNCSITDGKLVIL